MIETKYLNKSVPNSSLYFYGRVSWPTKYNIISIVLLYQFYYVKMGPYSSLILFLPSFLDFFLEFKSMPVYGRVSWPTKYNIISIVLLYQ